MKKLKTVSDIANNLHKLTKTTIKALINTYGFDKINRCELVQMLFDISSEGERIKPVFYTTYWGNATGLNGFYYNLIQGNYPTKYGYVTYTLKSTGARFIDIFFRPIEDYGPSEVFYHKRMGFHNDGKPIGPTLDSKLWQLLSE